MFLNGSLGPATQFRKTENRGRSFARCPPLSLSLFVKRRDRLPEYFMRRIEMQFPLDVDPVRTAVS